MAAGSWTEYQAGKLAISKAQVDLSSTTKLFVVLVGTGYTPAANTHSTYADISGSEVSGTGYTAGGTVIPSVTDTATSGTVKFTGGAISWTSSTISGAKYAVIVYRAAAGVAASTDQLISYVDLDTTSGSSTISTTNGTLTVTPNASGLFTLT